MLVGLYTPSSSHDTRHVEVSLCRAFHLTRFLNTIFQLQQLVSKMRRATVSTADSPYVVENKINNYFSCCCVEELVFILNIIRNNPKNNN